MFILTRPGKDLYIGFLWLFRGLGNHKVTETPIVCSSLQERSLVILLHRQILGATSIYHLDYRLKYMPILGNWLVERNCLCDCPIWKKEWKIESAKLYCMSSVKYRIIKPSLHYCRLPVAAANLKKGFKYFFTHRSRPTAVAKKA